MPSDKHQCLTMHITLFECDSLKATCTNAPLIRKENVQGNRTNSLLSYVR